MLRGCSQPPQPTKPPTPPPTISKTSLLTTNRFLREDRKRRLSDLEPELGGKTPDIKRKKSSTYLRSIGQNPSEQPPSSLLPPQTSAAPLTPSLPPSNNPPHIQAYTGIPSPPSVQGPGGGTAAASARMTDLQGTWSSLLKPLRPKAEESNAAEEPENKKKLKSACNSLNEPLPPPPPPRPSTGTSGTSRSSTWAPPPPPRTSTRSGRSNTWAPSNTEPQLQEKRSPDPEIKLIKINSDFTNGPSPPTTPTSSPSGTGNSSIATPPPASRSSPTGTWRSSTWGPTTSEHHPILSGPSHPPSPSMSSPPRTERSSKWASSKPPSSPSGTGRRCTWSLTNTEHQETLSESPEPERSRVRNKSKNKTKSPPNTLPPSTTSRTRRSSTCVSPPSSSTPSGTRRSSTWVPTNTAVHHIPSRPRTSENKKIVIVKSPPSTSPAPHRTSTPPSSETQLRSPSLTLKKTQSEIKKQIINWRTNYTAEDVPEKTTGASTGVAKTKLKEDRNQTFPKPQNQPESTLNHPKTKQKTTNPQPLTPTTPKLKQTTLQFQVSQEKTPTPNLNHNNTTQQQQQQRCQATNNTSEKTTTTTQKITTARKQQDRKLQPDLKKTMKTTTRSKKQPAKTQKQQQPTTKMTSIKQFFEKFQQKEQQTTTTNKNSTTNPEESEKKVENNSYGPAKGTKLDAENSTKIQKLEEENPQDIYFLNPDDSSPIPRKFSRASQNLPSIGARGPAVGEYIRTRMGLETALPEENTLLQSVGLAERGKY